MNLIKENGRMDFVPLSELLIEDEKAEQIKTIYKKEGEYTFILGPIESLIAFYYYYGNRNLRDRNVEIILKNLKRNLDKTPEFFNTELEKELMNEISYNLQISDKKLTQHELILVLDYILWAIDNRRSIGYSRAYLDWICKFFGLLGGEEQNKFNKIYDDHAKEFGIPKELINILKNEEGDFEITPEMEEFSRESSINFTEKEKKKSKNAQQ